jgi:hypothetical protein
MSTRSRRPAAVAHAAGIRRTAGFTTAKRPARAPRRAGRDAAAGELIGAHDAAFRWLREIRCPRLPMNDRPALAHLTSV